MAVNCNLAKDWVKLHYERDDDGVVAKSVMYKHYEDECKALGRPLMETSIFGRIVKSIFPDVNIRRLGGRDNLKYYYCGIRVQSNSKYFADNATTTRPKRRLRKRELVTDKADTHTCIRWLHANYMISPENSVVKADVYDGYVKHCAASNIETLSVQYFGMVITHVFPRITKRKLGPRANQQKYYFGITARPSPLPLDHVPNELLMTTVESVFNKGRLDYRDGAEDEEDEEQFCNSPISDTSELSPNGQESQYEEHHEYQPPFHGPSYIKQEGIEENFSNIQLKDEPIEEDTDDHDYKPLDLSNIAFRSRSMERDTPDRPSSAATYGSGSPSPPVKENKSRRLYKPRFHYYYNEENQWDDEPEIASIKDDVSFCDESEKHARDWVIKYLIEFDNGVYPNRDQIYDCYAKECIQLQIAPIPLTDFDITVFKVFNGGVTTRMSNGKTYYKGIRMNPYCQFSSDIEEMMNDQSHYEYIPDTEMDLSPSNDYITHNSLIDSPNQLEEYEEEPPDESLPSSYPSDNDFINTPEVLRDGKYYLKTWLTENFESVPNSCVLKADAYKHYDSYAKSMNTTPFEMNVFGKLVRQVFPNVSIRRLGGRIKPQYHYCGIGVKRTSRLYNLMSGKDPAQRSRKKEIATDNRSAEIVIDWLRQNYHPNKTKVIQKSDVFNNYSKFCSQHKESPVNVNYFGKLVKHCFPKVEVRKFGGRTEPQWYYHGLEPVNGEDSELTGGPHMVYRDEYSHQEGNPLTYDIQMNQPMPMGVSPYLVPKEEHYHSHHSSSPIPISMNNTNNHLGASHSYGSASVIVSPVLLNTSRSASESPLVNHLNSPYPIQSPRDQETYIIDPRNSHREQVFVGSPIEARNSYKETFGTRSPAEGGALKEFNRTVITRSPYESADVPTDNIYSRSPGDTAAQISRSPRSILIPHPHPSYQNYHELSSNHHENLQNIIRSPKESLLISRSPVEQIIPPEMQHKIRVVRANNGCQVVPSQTPPGGNVHIARYGSDRSIAHPPNIKRHKGQVLMEDEFEMLRDMSLK